MSIDAVDEIARKAQSSWVMVGLLILGALLPVAPELPASARYVSEAEGLKARRAQLAGLPLPQVREAVLDALDSLIPAWEAGSRRSVEALLEDVGLPLPMAGHGEGPGLYLVTVSGGAALLRVTQQTTRLCTAEPLPRCEGAVPLKGGAPVLSDEALRTWLSSRSPGAGSTQGEDDVLTHGVVEADEHDEGAEKRQQLGRHPRERAQQALVDEPVEAQGQRLEEQKQLRLPRQLSRLRAEGEAAVAEELNARARHQRRSARPGGVDARQPHQRAEHREVTRRREAADDQRA